MQAQLLGFGHLVHAFIEHQNERTVVYLRDEVSLDVFRETNFCDVRSFVTTARKCFPDIGIREHAFEQLTYAIVAVVRPKHLRF